MQRYSSFIISQNYFDNDGTQNYLVFEPLIKYFEVSKTTNPINISWKSKGFSNEIVKPPTIANLQLEILYLQLLN